MKKVISILVLLFVSLSSLMAQNSRREIGDIFVNAGTGLSFIHKNDYSSDYATVIPPMKVDGGYTVLDLGFGTLSAGAYVSLGVDRYTDFDCKFVTFMAGPMASLHVPVADNIDIFGKMIVGYVGVRTANKLVGNFINNGGIGAGAYVGGTWYFSPKMGVGAELGYGGPVTLGIHLTFKI